MIHGRSVGLRSAALRAGLWRKEYYFEPLPSTYPFSAQARLGCAGLTSRRAYGAESVNNAGCLVNLKFLDFRVFAMIRSWFQI
jgi:hypothetical protein